MKAITTNKLYYRDYTSMSRAEKLYWIKLLKPINEEDERCLQLMIDNEQA
jgi:hypothetical protein